MNSVKFLLRGCGKRKPQYKKDEFQKMLELHLKILFLIRESSSLFYHIIWWFEDYMCWHYQSIFRSYKR